MDANEHSPERACALVKTRLFRSSEEAERVPGFAAGMVDDLKSGGARLGRAQ